MPSSNIDPFTKSLSLKFVDDPTDGWLRGKDLYQSPLLHIPEEFCSSKGTPADYGITDYFVYAGDYNGHHTYHRKFYMPNDGPRNQDFYVYFPTAEEDEEWQAECLRDNLNNPEPEEWSRIDGDDYSDHVSLRD
jgi:hypothetical protein